MTAAFENILYEVERGRARITLNRPERRNALSLALQAELAEALWEADCDRRVHCVILKGAGPSFCAGYDLTGAGAYPVSRLSDEDSDYRGYRTLDDDAWQLEREQRYRLAIFDMHKPVIAQVHGHCMAGGTDLALLCDMVIAADDTLFGVPPSRNLGSLPGNLWLYHVGPQWAKRLLLTGDSITGADAQKLGFVMKAVPEDLLENEVEQLADRLAMIDHDLLSTNKRAINLGLELMGARTMQRLSAEIDVRAHNTQAAADFRTIARSQGIRAALKDRDEKFGDSRVRVDGPEIRDERGFLVSDD